MLDAIQMDLIKLENLSFASVNGYGWCQGNDNTIYVYGGQNKRKTYDELWEYKCMFNILLNG